MDGPVLSAPNICYELAEKTKAIAHGGIGAIHRLVQRVGLATRIDTDVRVLKVHQPYYESDHVLNIAYNLLCGGQTLDDIELRRTARVFLDALGTDSLPDPTTAGDFCRRFDEEQIEALMDAINETRLEVWQRCPGLVEETARIDGDGTLVPTTGACKEGMDIAYNGVWGYGPLLVSLANTGEPLFIKNRSANRPSHESAIPYFDKAVALCRRAGFTDVLLRGDTDFALTTAFDRWTTAGVRFVFGYDATATMVRWGQSAPPDLYEALVRRTERTLATAPRQRPANVKDRIVTDRGFKKITTVSEALVDFDYQPTTCTRPYRVVALKKNLSVERGEQVLFDDIRYFFGSIRVSQRYFQAFWGFSWVISWERPCGSSWKTRSVFQGAVGAFCASTAPSASTGPVRGRQDGSQGGEPGVMSNWTAASSDCGRDDVHIRTADLYRPNARFTPERQRYQVPPFGKLGYSHFFYITNDRALSCHEVVHEARQRCDQENLIAQLKGGVRALHAPVNTLHANWAYMVMAALAWSLKAWVALELPIAPRWRSRHEAEQRQLLRMDFRTFLGAFINVPCQIVTSGRRVIYRLLAWNPWQYLFLRFVDAT